MAALNVSSSNATNNTTPSSAFVRTTSSFIISNATTASSTLKMTPTEASTATSVVSSSTTYATSSSQGTIQCPDISNITSRNSGSGGKPAFSNSLNSSADLKLSTRDRKPWTVVKVECTRMGTSRVVYLQCMGTGQWNATIPECRDKLDVASFKVYFVTGGCVLGLVIFVLSALFCYAMRSRGHRPSRNSESSGGSEKNIYADPYYVGDVLARSASSKDTARSDIIYAKPVVYTTYLNPSYEDAYDRWRHQEQTVSERLYDSPWTTPRELKAQMETPEFKWSHSSLRTLDQSGFRKLPRVQLSTDPTSNKSHDTIGSAITNHLRDPLINQSSTSSRKIQFALKRHPLMEVQDKRTNTFLDKTVTGVSEDDDTVSSRVDFDGESTDGVTIL